MIPNDTTIVKWTLITSLAVKSMEMHQYDYLISAALPWDRDFLLCLFILKNKKKILHKSTSTVTQCILPSLPRGQAGSHFRLFGTYLFPRTAFVPQAEQRHRVVISVFYGVRAEYNWPACHKVPPAKHCTVTESDGTEVSPTSRTWTGHHEGYFVLCQSCSEHTDQEQFLSSGGHSESLLTAGNDSNDQHCSLGS